VWELWQLEHTRGDSISPSYSTPALEFDLLTSGIINLNVMQVSAVGVTGARSNVNLRVEHLLREIKKVGKL
jgi:hypothetical protein